MRLVNHCYVNDVDSVLMRSVFHTESELPLRLEIYANHSSERAAATLPYRNTTRKGHPTHPSNGR